MASSADNLIHRGVVFRAADKVEPPGERKVYDLGIEAEDEHPGWVLVPREPTDKMLSEPASMLPAAYTLTECCDLFREMWKVALEYAPAVPASPRSGAGEGEVRQAAERLLEGYRALETILARMDADIPDAATVVVRVPSSPAQDLGTYGLFRALDHALKGLPAAPAQSPSTSDAEG